VPLTLVAGTVESAVAVEPQVDVENARHAVEKFLEASGTPDNLKTAAVRRGIELIFVPYFDMLVVQAAEARPPVRSRLGVTRLSCIALDKEGHYLGADRIDPVRVRRTPSIPFDIADLSTRGVVLEPQRSAEAIGLPGVMSHPVTLERRVRVVYYPLWLARFSYGRSLYHVSVDAVRGEILRGVAPASIRERLTSGVAFMLLFSALIAVTLSNPQVVIMVFAQAPDLGALLAGLLALVLAAAWDRLRFRREVLLEGSRRKQVPVNRPKETRLEAVAALLLQIGTRRRRGFWSSAGGHE
jgi:hypothetical protein